MSKNNTLLDKAYSFRTKKKVKKFEITSQHHELFKAYARGDINLKQASYALGSNKNNAYVYLLAIAVDMAN